MDLYYMETGTDRVNKLHKTQTDRSLINKICKLPRYFIWINDKIYNFKKPAYIHLSCKRGFNLKSGLFWYNIIIKAEISGTPVRTNFKKNIILI